jgi:hypothetical protein
MDTINIFHGCARKIRTSRYYYVPRILLGESSFLFESFKYYIKGHSTHLLRGLTLYFFTMVTFHCMKINLSIRELKSPPKEEEGIHKFLPFPTVLAYQYIDPLVAI